MENTYETKDIVTAAYLKANDIYCIGTIPARNKYRPQERLWLFELTPKVKVLLQELEQGDPVVPIKKAFRCASILKNLLNDKDNFDDSNTET